jgi:hypothetical protein
MLPKDTVFILFWALDLKFIQGALLSDLNLKLSHSFVYCTPKNINFYINDINVYFLNSLPLYQNWEVANVYALFFFSFSGLFK